MITTLTLLVALQMPPGQAGGVALSNPRVTYGALGPTRPDTKVLPGDSLYLSFDVDGITTDPKGKVSYSTVTEVTDAKGNQVFKSPSRQIDFINALGGTSFPAYAQVDIGLEQAAGSYAVKITVTDQLSKKNQTLTQKFEVLPKGFGLARLHTTSDSEGRVNSVLIGQGDAVYVNGVIVGFSRDAAKKQPHVVLELRVLDDKGKPTLPEPFTGVINQDVPANAASLPGQFLLAATRPGKFQIEVKATDKISGKSVTQSFPITVLPNKP